MVLSVIFGAARSKAGTIGGYTQTNNAGEGDLIFISPVQGTNLGNNNISVGNLFTNRHVLTMQLDSTNGVTFSGTLSGTNGNNWFAYSGSAFSRLGIGDTIIIGTAQFLVAGLTNGNQTVAVIYNLTANYTNSAFTWYPAPMSLNDSTPRRTGTIGGGPGYTVSGYGIGNNGGESGGVWFTDGRDSASIVNSPSTGFGNFLAISEGLGRGNLNQNQFCIFAGSTYNALNIAPDNGITFTGYLSNWNSSSITLAQPIYTPGVTSSNFTIGTPTSISLTNLSCTNGNNWVALDSTDYASLLIGDAIIIGSEQYTVVGLTNGNKTASITPPAAAKHTNVAFTVYHCSERLYDSNGNLQGGRGGDGSVIFTGAPSGNSGKILLADGMYSTVIWNQVYNGVGYFSISFAPQVYNSSAGNQFNIAYGSIYNSLSIMANSMVSPTWGLSNINGGSVNIYGGGNISGGAVLSGGVTITSGGEYITGAETNTGGIVCATAGSGLTIKSGSNARLGTNELSGGYCFVSNTSITANTAVFAQLFTPAGWTATGASEGATLLMVSNAPGSGFAVQNFLNGADTNWFKWVAIEGF